MSKDFLWAEKYRPKVVDDVILPKDLKSVFKEFVKIKNVPNLLLSGPPGIGKTSVAKAMLDELGCDYIIKNGSLEGNIVTLRTDILTFASSVSFVGGRKYVILDEADYLNPTSTQPALRNFMEEYSSNCGFILTCNYKDKIIKELHSRCSVVEFKINKSDMVDVAGQFVDRVTEILSLEKIEYHKNDMLKLVSKYFPDFRRCLGELQRYSITGKLELNSTNDLKEDAIKELFVFMKDKDFTSIRKWLTDNSESDYQSLYRLIYNASPKYLVSNGIAQLVVLLSKYQYQEAFVADKEINAMALLVEIMLHCEFK